MSRPRRVFRAKDYKGNRDGSRQCAVSGETGGSVYPCVTQDRVVLEIQRGCIRGCRFCQAGQLYRPVREKSLETLKHYATTMLDSTGQGRNFAFELLEFQRLFPSGRAGRLPDDDLSGEKSEYFPAFSAN